MSLACTTALVLMSGSATLPPRPMRVASGRPMPLAANAHQFSRRGAVTFGALCASTFLSPVAPATAKVAFDMTRYGDRELQIATQNRLKQSLRDAAQEDPTLVPAFYELAVLDAIDYSRNTGDGGLNGSVRKAKLTSPVLKKAVDKLVELQKVLSRQTEVTFADILAYAGAQAVEVAGGPKVSVQLGREDNPGADGAEVQSIDAMDAAALRAAFSSAGLGAREIVLIGGSLGAIRRATQAAKPKKMDMMSADEDEEEIEALAGYAEPDKSYKALGMDVRLQGALVGIDGKSAFGPAYLADLVRSGAKADDRVGALIAEDSDLRALAARYAGNANGFSKEVVEVYQQVTTLGKFTSTRNS